MILKAAFRMICFLTAWMFTLCAVAQDKPAVANHAIATPDKKMTIITAPVGAHTAYVDDNAGSTVIYSSLANDYPNGLYWCCQGSTISGPESALFVEWWQAAAFTPSADTAATKVVVSIGYLGGNDKTIILSINADNAGIPGAVIEQWVLGNLGAAGTCCSVQSKAISGINLTAGQRYWIVASTGAKSDVWASWNQADSDQVDTFLNAGLTNQNGGTWESFMTTPNLAFAVFGH
jgi:hypothetical protein